MQVPELMNAYARIDTLFVRGEGTRLWDTEGKEYLDALAGIAVCGLGHAHPKVSKAICDQAHTITHTSNLFHNEPQQRLAKALCALSGMDNVFFSNSGAEANEAALKIARKYGNDKGISNPTVITFEKSFHGRTMATISATANSKVKDGFYPLLDGFVHAPYDDIDALKAIAENNKDIVAVFVEPVQGEGGVNVPADNYLSELRALCDANDWLLMLDEIQTGIGRTGKFLAYQHTSIQPDVITLAKGLGNGFPVGACLAHGKAALVIQPGNHGSTFGGNPLASHTAKTVLDIIIEENLVENANRIGKKIISELQAALNDVEGVVDIRGKGLMIGIELNKPCGELVQAALNEGVVLNVTAGNVIRLLPPLIFNDSDADTLIQTVTSLVKDFS
ncbi:acetylornithine/succinylornithine family transaminase [Aurantivibrio plasticivorans]